MSSHLFLGGPWDGQVHKVDPWSWFWVVPNPLNGGEFSTSLYAAQRIYLQPPTFQHGPSHTWLVFVVGALPDLDDVMNLLFQLDVPPETRLR